MTPVAPFCVRAFAARASRAALARKDGAPSPSLARRQAAPAAGKLCVMDTDTAPRNFLLYDGDCPFCSNYVRMVQLRKAVGPVELLDMRQHPDLVAHFRDRGYDLNEGMLLRLDGHIYWGADCINRLALLSSDSDLFNQVNAAIFRRPCLSAVLYPFMTRGRALTLALLGKKKMPA